jgi:hypothetical protein
MIRAASAVVLLALTTAPGAAAWQQRPRAAVAVPSAEASDNSLKTAAARLTDALRATIALTGYFELYDTVETRKSTLGAGGQRLVSRLPTRYVCQARVSPAIPGWAQATIAFVDAPFKDPVVRLSSPVLLRTDSSFVSLARLAWERLTKAERKRLDSLRSR